MIHGQMRRAGCWAIVATALFFGIGAAQGAGASTASTGATHAASAASTAPATATTWHVQPSANAPGNRSSKLVDVACSAANSCVGVGSSYPNPVSQCCSSRRLVERWNGSTWAIQDTPGLSNPVNEVLNAVACGGPASCTAVGYTDPNNLLIEHWNGTAWSLQTSPVTGGSLSDVSCPSPMSCFAVGARSNGTTPLIEGWNGTSWSVLPTPPAITTYKNNFYNSIACLSNTACTAVGVDETQPPVQGGPVDGLPIVARWNGSSWSVGESAAPSGKQSELETVSCPTTTMCMATGVSWLTRSDGSIYDQARLVELWNGHAWVITSTPAPPSQPQPPFVHDVDCASASSCIVVGVYLRPGGPDGSGHPLAIRWNGHAWSLDTTVKIGDSELSGVTCEHVDGCMAAGDAWTGSTYHTLVETTF